MGRVGALDRPLHHGTGRPFRQSLHHKVVTVEMLTGNRKEAIAGLEGPGIRAYARNVGGFGSRFAGVRSARDGRPEDPGQVFNREVFHSFLPTIPYQRNKLDFYGESQYRLEPIGNQRSNARTRIRAPCKLALSCREAGGIMNWDARLRRNEDQKVGLMNTVGKGLDDGLCEHWGES